VRSRESAIALPLSSPALRRPIHSKTSLSGGRWGAASHRPRDDRRAT
jgi:hypothetical protein